MESNRIAIWSLIAVFLAILFVEGPVQAVLDWRNEGQPRVADLVTQAPTQDNLRAFESALERESWSADAIRPLAQYGRYAVLGDLGAKALAGADDWLFYRPGVDFLVQPWDPASLAYPNDPVAATADFQQTLAARGIALLVVVAPGKASVYPDKLGGGAPSEVQRHPRQFLAGLEKAGIASVNLYATFNGARDSSEKPLYLQRDTHWTPTGLAIAADAVAQRVLDGGWVAKGDTAYNTRPVDVARAGDVLAMTDSAHVQAAYAAESVACEQVIGPGGTPYADATTAPILVLGDSFLRIYQADEPGAAGFIAHLAKALQQPVASIVSDGGASTLVRQELARKPELLAGKKLVIWEFVERDLRFGTEGWQRVAMRE